VERRNVYPCLDKAFFEPIEEVPTTHIFQYLYHFVECVVCRENAIRGHLHVASGQRSIECMIAAQMGFLPLNNTHVIHLKCLKIKESQSDADGRRFLSPCSNCTNTQLLQKMANFATFYAKHCPAKFTDGKLRPAMLAMVCELLPRYAQFVRDTFEPQLRERNLIPSQRTLFVEDLIDFRLMTGLKGRPLVREKVRYTNSNSVMNLTMRKELMGACFLCDKILFGSKIHPIRRCIYKCTTDTDNYLSKMVAKTDELDSIDDLYQINATGDLTENLEKLVGNLSLCLLAKEFYRLLDGSRNLTTAKNWLLSVIGDHMSYTDPDLMDVMHRDGLVRDECYYEPPFLVKLEFDLSVCDCEMTNMPEDFPCPYTPRKCATGASELNADIVKWIYDFAHEKCQVQCLEKLCPFHLLKCSCPYDNDYTWLQNEHVDTLIELYKPLKPKVAQLSVYCLSDYIATRLRGNLTYDKYQSFVDYEMGLVSAAIRNERKIIPETPIYRGYSEYSLYTEMAAAMESGSRAFVRYRLFLHDFGAGRELVAAVMADLMALQIQKLHSEPWFLVKLETVHNMMRARQGLDADMLEKMDELPLTNFSMNLPYERPLDLTSVILDFDSGLCKTCGKLICADDCESESDSASSTDSFAHYDHGFIPPRPFKIKVPKRRPQTPYPSGMDTDDDFVSPKKPKTAQKKSEILDKAKVNLEMRLDNLRQRMHVPLAKSATVAHANSAAIAAPAANSESSDVAGANSLDAIAAELEATDENGTEVMLGEINGAYFFRRSRLPIEKRS